jgi:hypothetical protein
MQRQEIAETGVSVERSNECTDYDIQRKAKTKTKKKKCKGGAKVSNMRRKVRNANSRV